MKNKGKADNGLS